MRSFELPSLPANCTLGLNYSGMHDSAIAIVAPGGRPVFAASLERLSRVKQDGRPPWALLDGLPWDRIGKVAVSTEAAFAWPQPEESRLLKARLPQARTDGLRHPPAFYDFLERLPCAKEFVPHQVAHAASVFWGSGFDEALCLTYDGGMCNSPWFGGLFQATRAEGLRVLDQFSALHYAKITSLYTFVTALLGFTPNKHEGKITGLAAYGRPTEACRQLLRHWFEDDFFGIEAVMEWVFAYDDQQVPMLVTSEGRIESYRAEAAGFSREELAATVQAVAEDHIVGLLGQARDLGWRSPNLCLAGGLFANVRINQRAVESGFERLFVAPPMTDDGTALGAAWHVQSREPGFAPAATHTMFLGPAYGAGQVREALRSEGVRFRQVEQPAREIAALLEAGAVVAVFQGASEFGPRALGNRSILAQATQADINQQLNARLNRTEFMPFAPMTRAEDVARCYVDSERVAHAMEFMTVTVDCTEAMRAACPAVVHVDGTARPQIVTAEHHPLIHAVLTEYVQRTGVPAIVNTSFNIHEEPIVCSPQDALRGFFESGLDYLYLDDGILVAFEDNQTLALRYLQERVRQPAPKAKTGALLLGLQSRRMAALQAELEVKETEIHEKESVIHEKEAVIHEKQAALERLTDDLQVLTGSLLDKEDALLGLSGDLQGLTASLHEKEDALLRLHAEMQVLTGSLQEKEFHLQEKEGDLQEKHRALMDLTGSLQEKEAVIRQLQHALAAERSGSI
ncbi:carbamoyltransferase C-terminal domain-containing protein [Ramlibacter sp.]|uniref:carbamoyltransferase C-terminal domain-containing protein n=1 Tax=Ramlibacter sp. TaxID=1917967 RepID=UPI0026205011|nr:carbamoyltransferase C-terminal domain-containing protein [Ramlibacter sp.]MDB5957146.1 bifunctional carbamoyltransferase/glycosyltransferase [Ramlibacter sp.]